MPDKLVELPGGLVLSPNRGILGINDNLEVYEGYDNECDGGHRGGKWVDFEKFTKKDRREIADQMIGLWNKWADGGK